MPSQSPSRSPPPMVHSAPDNQSLVDHLAAGLKLVQEQQLRRRRSQTPNPKMNLNTEELDEADEPMGYRVKRPRTPSSVPPIPVSKVPNMSAKIVKSTESLHVHNSPVRLPQWKLSSASDKDDIVTFGGGGRERSPLQSRSKCSSSNNSDQAQQFCLKWNSYQTNLSKEFDDLLQNESFVDVTLACDGHSVKAHKMVLSACSPYFQALFFDNPCQHPIIIMKEVKWPELKAVVEYMYRGEINVCRDQIEPLLRVANMLKIRGLTDVDQYLNASSPDDDNDNDSSASPVLAAKVSRKSPKIDLQTSGGPPKSIAEGYAKKVQEKMRELVDINENVEKVFHQHHHHHQQLRNELKGAGGDSSRMSPASKVSDSEKKCANIVRGGGISVRDRDHLMQPDSPIALTVAAQDRMHRANLAARKRRWMGGGGSGDGGAASPLPENPLTNRSTSPDNGDNLRESPASLLAMQNSSALQMIQQQQQQQSQQQGHHHQSVSSATSAGSSGGGGNSASSSAAAAAAAASLPFSLPQSTLESMGLSAALGLPPANTDDMEIKPGIAEMIREEERAKLLESSHAWLGASTSSIADSYQYQLQSMWQKCWNTNHNMVHQLRFRERGPLKSWRPETMAEAIFSVLKEGLSLSQAARKYDIPYPTFVLYANRVHNMLGPSMDGGTDLRPKGRGRPQRILLGIWPDDHIRGVIKTVVFRDAKELKEEVGVSSYDRQAAAGAIGYPGALSNGMAAANNMAGAGQQTGSESMSPDAAAAAVAAVAHGIRQQMQMVAAAHNYTDAANLVSGLNHLNMYPTNNGGSANNMPMPKIGSPATSGLTISSNLTNPSAQHRPTQQQHPPAHHQLQQRRSPSGLNITRINSPNPSVHDLIRQSPDDSSLSSSLEMAALEPAVNLAVGVSGFKSAAHRQYLHDDLADLVSGSSGGAVGRPRLGPQSSSAGGGIKMEPVGECRGD